MKFSIITPCFNSRQFLKETMLSVLTQKGDFSIEYFFIDGNSTDESVSIARQIQQDLLNNKIQPGCKEVTLHLISEPDNGMYDAVCKGLERSRGDVTAYLNSDDIYFPGALACVAQILTKYPQINWLSSRHVKIDSEGKKFQSFLPFSYNRQMLRAGLYGRNLPYVQQENVFWRSSLTGEIDLKTFRSFKLAGDFYLWFSFALRNQLYIADREIAAFRTHHTQLSQVQRERYEQEFNLIKIDWPYNRLKVLSEQVKNYKLPEFLKTLFSPTIIKGI